MNTLGVALAGLLGLVVGSFLTVVASRVPAGESIVTPRSRCASCSTTLTAAANVPIISYVVQHGRCRSCGVPIPVRYPLIEATTAGLFCAVTVRYRSPLEAAAYCVFAAVLVALTTIDLEHYRLPTPIIVVGGLLGGVLLVARSMQLSYYSPLLDALLVAAVGGGGFLLVALIAPRALGLGDVRLAALCGLFVGWLGLRTAAVGYVTCFLTAGVLGVVLLLSGRASGKTRVPFGPFLALGALVAVLAGSNIARVWLG